MYTICMRVARVFFFVLSVCLFVHVLLLKMRTRNKTVEMVACHLLHDVLHELQPMCHWHNPLRHDYFALVLYELKIEMQHSLTRTHTKSSFVSKSRVVGEEHVTIMACPFCSKFELFHIIWQHLSMSMLLSNQSIHLCFYVCLHCNIRFRLLLRLLFGVAILNVATLIHQIPAYAIERICAQASSSVPLFAIRE